MVKRITPEEYFQYGTNSLQEPVVIPIWVPILIGICIIGAFAVAIYAISKLK